MSTNVLSVRLPEDLKQRLDALSTSTGRTAAYYVREAVEQHLQQLEYSYTLRAEVEASRRAELQSRSLEEISADLGLDEPA